LTSTPSPPGGGPAHRLGYLDWLRGVGVLIMIEAHTIDSWTLVSERGRPAFRWALVLGGFGAPIFLFLAGVAMVLAANSRVRRGMNEAEATRRAARRAWQIFGLAFLFRLQSLLISGGGLRAFLKVDILNVMGVTMALAVWLWQIGRSARGRMFVLLVATIAVAMLTPPIRATSWLDWLPDPVEAYLRPSPGRSTFTLFPWGGFLFGGVLAGMWIDAVRVLDEARRNAILFAVGAVVALAAYASAFLPPIYAQTSYWTSSPTFFFVRLGIIAGLIPVAYAWSRTRWGRTEAAPLRAFGVASLFVYWIHVEMVYGVLSTPLHGALTFEQAQLAMALFSLFLFSLVRLKQRWSTGKVGAKSSEFTPYRAGTASNRPQSG
jgi:uncharacterized membrane protein